MQPEAERITRAASPALDEILGKTFPVLDDGFVRVVDYMGDDSSIVQAARVSYGAGTKKVSEDRGLIRYLLRHRHTTPFEMCELKLHVRVPMDAWRQWIRHRTACLAEGTEVYFDLPGGIGRRGNQLYKLKIEDIWQRFQPTSNTQRPDKQRNPYFRRDRVKQMKLRQANDDTLAIQHTKVVNVYKNGRKPVFRFELEDGKVIEATADHKFLFSDGWSTAKERLSLVNRDGLAIWNKGDYYLQINGQEAEVPQLHQDKEWLNDQYNIKNHKIDDIAEACGVSYHTVRKWLKLYGIQHAKGGRSRPAWNKGKQYKLGRRPPTPKQLAAVRVARSGPASNFWKGGISSDRESIGRWTTQAAPRIHERNQWTCQLCHQRTSDLHCHHIVPVWADIEQARNENNLTTLCGKCHREIAGDELAYVEKLGGPPVKAEWVKRPRTAWNKLTKTRLSRIKSIKYVGEKETYDLEVEGPHHNFIANGIVTHNSVNEYSTRYSVAIDSAQTTAPDQWRTQTQQNKQGSGEPVDPTVGADLSALEKESQDAAWATYQERIDQGVAREQARKDLPLCTYTEAYWKIDLHNLLHFLALRMDGHAQKEIRDYATVIGEQIVAKWVPLTWEAFLDYRFHATGLSRIEGEILAAVGAGEPERAKEIARGAGWLEVGKKGLKGNRERRELEDKLQSWGVDVPWKLA